MTFKSGRFDKTWLSFRTYLAFVAAAFLVVGLGGREGLAGPGGGFDPLEGLQRRDQDDLQRPEFVRGIVDVYTRLNVRRGPGIQHAIIGKLYPGDPVRIFAQQDGWFKIGWKAGRAWVFGYYVRRVNERFHNRSIARPDWEGRDLAPLGRDRWGRPLSQEPMGSGKEPQPPSGGRPPVQRGSSTYLDVPLYSQGRVGGRYPSGYCGPTTLKMVAEYFGIRKHVDDLALQRVGPGTPMYRPGRGSTHQGIATMAKHLGLKNSYLSYGRSFSWLQQQVRSGRPVIVGVKGNYAPGRSSRGHITAVVGFTRNGDVIINDSGGGVRRTVPRRQFYNAWSRGNGGRMAVVVSP